MDDTNAGAKSTEKWKKKGKRTSLPRRATKLIKIIARDFYKMLRGEF